MDSLEIEVLGRAVHDDIGRSINDQNASFPTNRRHHALVTSFSARKADAGGNPRYRQLVPGHMVAPFWRRFVRTAQNPVARHNL
jgi:hypothetical protein